MLKKEWLPLYLNKLVPSECVCYFCYEIGFSATDTIIKIRKIFHRSYLPKSTLYHYFHDITTINGILFKKPGKLDRVDYKLENQISDLITTTPCQSGQQLARQLRRSPTAIMRYLHEDLGMVRKNCIIVSHELTPEMKQAHIKFSKVTAAILQELEPINFLPLATTVESWLYYYNAPKQSYVQRGTTPPTLTVHGVIGEYSVPIKSTVNSALWNERILKFVDLWCA